MKRVEVCAISVIDMIRHLYQTVEGYPGVYQWLETEEGKFITKHSKRELQVLTQRDYEQNSMVVKVYAILDGPTETFWRLKFR